MAEVMATIGLVAAIIDISCFTKRLVDRCREFHSKDVPKAFRSIRVQLPLVVSSLERIREQAESGLLSEDLLNSMQSVIEACHEEVKDLEVILNKTLPAPSASSWDRSTLAMRSLRHEAELKRSTANLDRHISMLMFYQIGQLTAKPSLLRETLSSLEAIQYPDSAPIAEELSDEINIIPQNQLRERWCTCKRPRIQKSWTIALLGATIGSQTIHAHRRGCPLFREEDEIIKMSLGISLISRLVNKAAGLSLSLQYGAGGMSVSPSLTLRGMKRRNSPIFALLKTLDPPERSCNTPKRVLRMNEILPRITLLIQNGQASPYDVDENGQTVFDVFFDRKGLSSEESKPAYREPRDFFIRSLCYLGFSSDEELSRGCFGRGTLLDMIVRQDLEGQDSLDVRSLSELINLGVGFGGKPEHLLDWLQEVASGLEMHHTFGQNVPKFAVHLMKSLSDFADRCNCNALHFAVLERSASKVERYLRCYPNMLSAQNLLGQTSLHLAADWPWACEALLKAGADISTTDFCGNLPISYACFQDCFETVKILIAANSPLSSSRYELSVLDRAITMVNNESIYAALINELAARRHKLFKSSQVLLLKQTFEKLTTSLKGLPDIEAFSLIEALIDAGDNIDPNHWSFTYSSVYDLEEITVEIAERLFAAGFVDLEGKDSNGFTTLLRIAMKTDLKPELAFAKIHWLLSKGVSLQRCVETEVLSKWHIPSVNFVSAMLGQVINKITKHVDDSEEETENDLMYIGSSMKEVLREVLGSQYQNCHDSCKCHCSLQGCTPLAMLLKGWKRTWWGTLEIEEELKIRGSLIDWILEMLAHDLTASETIELTNSTLRFCLFEDLGLGHICCRPTHWAWADQDLLPPIEAEEAHEIQEEDEKTLEKFHSLLPKAEFEYRHASIYFSEFWSKFYHEDIVSSLQDGFHDHHDGSTLKIGVRMHKVDRDEVLESLQMANAIREEKRRLKMDVKRIN